MEADKRVARRDYYKGVTAEIAALEEQLRELKEARDIALWMDRDEFTRIELGEFTGLTHGRVSQIIAVQESTAKESPCP